MRKVISISSHKSQAPLTLMLLAGALLSSQTTLGFGARSGLPVQLAAKPGSVRSLQVRGVQFEMVLVPAGKFLMGASTGNPDEQPRHQVSFPSAFEMGRTEVTGRQFRAFLDATGYRTDRNWHYFYDGQVLTGCGRDQICGGRNQGCPSVSRGEDSPAFSVSWRDAVAFCQWLSKETGLAFRLPTEAEWEYACRVEEALPVRTSLSDRAWFGDNSGGQPHPVARKAPNGWGLYDMLGNVWEWCLDSYAIQYGNNLRMGNQYVERSDALGLSARRLLRGGAGHGTSSQTNSTGRFRGLETLHCSTVGFRVVGSAPEPQPVPSLEGRHDSANRDSAPAVALQTLPPTTDSPRGSIKLLAAGEQFLFVPISKGTFYMGNEPVEFKMEDQGPIHPVKIDYDYALGQTEVTRQQFQAFIAATGYRTDAEMLGFASFPKNLGWYSGPGISWREPGFPQTGQDPVICLSWFDAQEFCAWLSRQTGRTFRLPSEAEWEYACWAGQLEAPSLEAIPSGSWFRYNSEGRTHPVAQKRPNAWGLYDMLGNAWEWCLDGWEGNYEGAPSDGRPWSVVAEKIGMSRGGSYVNSAAHLHPSNRMPMRGDTLQLNNGFRLALEIEPPSWRAADLR